MVTFVINMAKNEEKPTPVDKGKGKAIDGAEASKEREKDKDGKIIKDGQKGVLPTGMSSYGSINSALLLFLKVYKVIPED